MIFNKRTKIIATIGPSSDSPELLEKLIVNGADCIRLNFSHGDHTSHGKIIQLIRKVEKKLERNIAIIADIQGPKMRVGIMPKEGVMLNDGEEVTLDCSKNQYEGAIIPIRSETFAEGTKVGDPVFLDDGVIKLEITEKQGGVFKARVVKGGLLFSNKGINVPSLQIKGSVLSAKDRSDIEFAVASNADYVAISFLRDANDVREAKAYINNPHIKVIAKIERPEAIKNIDEIIEESDAVMVARGDLGIETPLWELPIRQKEIIEKVRAKMKPVIVATQMLDSMIRNPLPTSAEVSDVANAVYDSADAVMLSGETASGKNPLEAVEMMGKILQSTEKSQHYVEDLNEAIHTPFLSIARSASDIASEIKSKAIFVETLSGETAKTISYFRPKNMIIAITDNEKIACQLALVWGVIPYVLKKKSIKKIQDLITPIAETLKEKNFLKSGDTIVCVYDETFKLSGKANTNTISIQTV